MTGKQHTQYDNRMLDAPEGAPPIEKTATDIHALEEQVRSLLELNASLRQRVDASESAMRNATAAIDRQREQRACHGQSRWLALRPSMHQLFNWPHLRAICGRICSCFLARVLPEVPRVPSRASPN
ncbi:hypothetical protein GGQ64_001608 [Rhizobium azooxidifex]|uniref:Uncharacterized protein n=1 Tax=Mycoplana azooxidifex TaxID=1636188 RepID=A0A7W6D5S0_9HYPH|nr:hypothetical protein [Mycoplana azooxidifex]MBB3976419.1 hypothetical protein [Mycoplana azooxidifex]